MARINAEDDWWKDKSKRRAALIKAVARLERNVEREADGTAMDAWRLSQEYWKSGKRLIPLDVWKRAELDVLVDCDLAEIRPDGVYVRGAADQHDWLRKNSLGGTDRAKGPRDSSGRFAAKTPSHTVDPPSDHRSETVDPPSEAPTTVHLRSVTAPLTVRDGTVDGPCTDRDGPAVHQPPSSFALSSEETNTPYNPPSAKGDLGNRVDDLVSAAVRAGLDGCEAYDKGLKNTAALDEFVVSKCSPQLRSLISKRYGGKDPIGQFLRAVYKSREENKIRLLRRELRATFKAQLLDDSTGPPRTGPPPEFAVQ